MKIHHVLQPLFEFFEVPNKTLEPLKKHYIEAIQRARRDNTKRVTDKAFPPKKFLLDFSGTKYEFLKSVNTPLKMSFSSSSSGFFPDNNEIVVELGSNNALHYYRTLEHEVLHFIQKLIGIYKKGGGKTNYAHGYGGISTKRVARDWKDELSVSGYKTDSKGSRRTTHAKRPIEHYTNLNTLVRELQFKYDQHISNSPEYETLKTDKRAKKDFLISFIKNAASQDDLSVGYALNTVKKQSTALYNLYLKVLYKGFVDGEPVEDIPEIRKKLAAAIKPRDEIDRSNMTQEKDIVVQEFADKMKNKTFGVEMHDVSAWSELDDSNLEFVEMVLNATKGIRTTENSDGYEIARIPLNPIKLKNILKQWRQMAEEVDDVDKKRNYKVMSNNMVDDEVKYYIEDNTDRQKSAIIMAQLHGYIEQLWR